MAKKEMIIVPDEELNGLIEKYEFYVLAESHDDSVHKENSGVLNALEELELYRLQQKKLRLMKKKAGLLKENKALLEAKKGAEDE